MSVSWKAWASRCGRKMPYPSKTEARVAVKRIGDGVRAYRCPWCDAYHVGTPSQGSRR